MEKIESTSLNLTDDNIKKLKELFPNVFTEGKIDFDALRIVLGNKVEEKIERYQFTWPGKTESIKIAQTPSSATLRADKDKSKYWDTTKNLYIEGDNLEVLKLLQKTYYGKIKMIYIDPPYNTGKDFVYSDNFNNAIDNYKAQTLQTFKTNPETSGRFHSDWLNMLYSRLLVARNFLSADGVIFISIDDNENCNCKKICDEIFGENNFITQIIWKKRSTPPNDQVIGAAHEYILIYAKSIDEVVLNLRERSDEQNNRYRNPDNHPKGPWAPGDLSANVKGGRYVPSLNFPILNPNTGEEHYPPHNGNWRFNKDKIQKLLENNEISFGENGLGRPKLKRFLCDVKQGITYTSVWDFVPLNTQGSKEMTELLGNLAVFDNPKPVDLIKELIKMGSQPNSYILDFFSGSATTAHATMQINAEDGGNRHFILVQLPELCDEKSEAYKAGYQTICDIGEERIRRAGEKIKREWEEKNTFGDLFVDENRFSGDIGFKVFRLDSTNITAWDNENKLDEQTLFTFYNVFKEGRSNEDILYEIMLKYGIFDQPIEGINVNNKIMYKIGRRYMIVCLTDYVTEKDIVAIGNLLPRVVVFKESGFKDDNDKINAEYNLKNLGVEDVKCI